GGIREGFVVMPGQALHDLGCIWANYRLVVVGAHMVCDRSGMLNFAVTCLLEAHRASVYRSIQQSGHACHNSRGVHSSAEKTAEWNLTHEANTYRISEGLLQAFTPLALTPLFDLAKVEVPICGLAGASFRKNDIVSGRHFPDFLIDTLRRWN